jgi:hypothetical protein
VTPRRRRHRRGGRGTRIALLAGMRLSVFLPLVLVVAPAAARAETETFIAEGSVAAGMVIGRLAWDGPDAYGTGDIHLRTLLVAPVMAVAGFLGDEVSRGMALGLGVDATLVPWADAKRLGQTHFEHGYELAATFAGVIRTPDHVWRAGVGVAVAGFVGGATYIGTVDNVVDFETLLGPVARASLAWPMSPGVAFAVEVRAGYLFADHLSYLPVTLQAALHF